MQRVSGFSSQQVNQSINNSVWLLKWICEGLRFKPQYGISKNLRLNPKEHHDFRIANENKDRISVLDRLNQRLGEKIMFLIIWLLSIFVWFVVIKNRKETSLTTRFFSFLVGSVIGCFLGLSTGVAVGGDAFNGAGVFGMIGGVIALFSWPEIKKALGL